MVEEVITPQGISRARRSATRMSTRLITFPDGITRHITLPGWQWAALDRFDREDVLLSSKKIIAMAFEAAQADTRYPDEPFEETLRHHFSIGLAEGFCFSSDYILGHANDC